MLDQVLLAFKDCSDLTHRRFPLAGVDVLYFKHQVGSEPLRKEVLEPFGSLQIEEIEELLLQSQYELTPNGENVVNGVLTGSVAIFYNDRAYLFSAYSPESRSIQAPDMESVITGPMDSFTESLSSNLSLIRRRLKDSRLKTVSFSIGRKTHTSFTLLYMDKVCNPDHVRLLRSKLEELDIETITDTNSLVEFLEPKPFYTFPQFLTSTRPDLVAANLSSGKVVGMLEGSPFAFSAPVSFFEFFASPDDYYQPWLVSSAVRLLRFIALLITLTFTASYVTIVSYHYEMIPPKLLLNLMESRNKVPFSPLIEAIIMEMTIELLREAGARLPTKIGPTIGTVGGIVIGTAAVQAGITSNILIISVAISAIASFTVPNYIMSSSIRLLRFGIILLAGLLGNFGLMFGLAYIIIELSKLNMFGTSFLYPVAPLKPKRWLDLLIRAPLQVVIKIIKRSTKNAS